MLVACWLCEISGANMAAFILLLPSWPLDYAQFVDLGYDAKPVHGFIHQARQLVGIPRLVQLITKYRKIGSALFCCLE